VDNKAIIGLFKAQDSGKGVVIEGWANKAVIDRGGDIIPKSAWNVENFKKNSIILFNHDKNFPIGKAVTIEARDEGLYVKAKISGSADPGISRIRDLIKEGVLNAFSVGFDSSDEVKSADGYNEIKAAELFEISVVSIPMNQDSLFSTTKFYDIENVKTKAIEIFEGEYGSSSPAPDKNEASSPSTAAKAQGEDDGKPSESGDKAEESQSSDEDESKAPDTDSEDDRKPSTETKEVEIEISSIKVPKDAFASLEEASAFLAEAGYKTEGPTEEEGYFVFPQMGADAFQSTSEIVIDEEKKILAVVGALRAMVDEESEEEPTPDEVEAAKALVADFESEKELVENAGGPANRVDNEQLWAKAKRASKMALGRVDMAFVLWWYLRHGGQKVAEDYETKEIPTQPLPDAPVVGSDNVLIQTAQQTNVLLGQLVAETQGVREAIGNLQQELAMIPKQAPVEMPPPPPAQTIPADQGAPKADVAKYLDVVRQSLEITRNKIELLERRDAL
jgi:HK97 family phage prohead protease